MIEEKMNSENRELSPRQKFAEEIFEGFSDGYPAAYVSGDLADGIWMNDGDRLEPLDLILKQALNFKKDEKWSPENSEFDYVVVYNAAEKQVHWGDERLEGIDKSDQIMQNNFKIPSFSNGAQGVNPALMLFGKDKKLIQSSAETLPNQTFFEVIDLMISNGKKVCVIFEDIENVIPEDKNSMTVSQDDRMNGTRIKGLLKKLRRKKGHRFIFIDNEGKLSAKLSGSAGVKKYEIPPTSEIDLKPILKKVFKGEQLKRAIELSLTTDVQMVIELIENKEKSDKELIQILIKKRERKIREMSDGLLEPALREMKEEEMALSLESRKYWKKQTRAFQVNTNLVERGYLLSGPPGTGKSILPKFIASQLGIPYLKLSDLSTSGLSNVSLDKAKKVFNTVFANKPCVLHLDEVDKLFPNSNDDYKSSNNNQLMGYIQDKISDDDFMNGIILIGTTNEPWELSDAMRRDGRFGTNVYMGPPKSSQEKLSVFKAIWHQLDHIHTIELPHDEFLISCLNDLPEYAMGANFKAILRDALRDSFLEILPITETLLSSVKLAKKTIKKSSNYDEINRKCLALHNAWPLGESVKIAFTKEELAKIKEANKVLTAKKAVTIEKAKLRELKKLTNIIEKELQELKKQKTNIRNKIGYMKNNWMELKKNMKS